ncbi:MAG: response regulator transcription factor [Gammaproteobacteria bacterium]|nr:response regulator transcription factor [Gammaproteobacteria bacterium]
MQTEARLVDADSHSAFPAAPWSQCTAPQVRTPEILPHLRHAAARHGVARRDAKPSPAGAALKRTRAGAPHRILIIDDHPIVRQGLRRLIEQEKDLTVCGEAASSGEGKAAIRDLKPDVIIVDITLREGDGVELVKEAHARDPMLPILVLSMHDEMLYAERMLAAGATGYIMKQAESGQFLAALRRVLQHRIYVSEVVGTSIIEKFTGGVHSANPVDVLSDREVQIMQMIGRGLTTRQAAQELNLSVKTIESHRQHIKRKLNLASGTQLLQYAMNWFSGSDVKGAQRA